MVVHIEECYSQLCVGLKGGSRESKTRLVDLRELNSVCYYMILPFHFCFKMSRSTVDLSRYIHVARRVYLVMVMLVSKTQETRVVSTSII